MRITPISGLLVVLLLVLLQLLFLWLHHVGRAELAAAKPAAAATTL